MQLYSLWGAAEYWNREKPKIYLWGMPVRNAWHNNPCLRMQNMLKVKISLYKMFLNGHSNYRLDLIRKDSRSVLNVFIK